MATKKRYYPLRSSANPTKVVLVEITEEQYHAVFPEIWAARKREQRHGRCKCPAEYSWTCNADCLDCPFHVHGDTTSLEELTEHGEEWNALEVSQTEDTPLEDDLIACSYKVILINVQKILNKYVHMLSYMSCIEGAHYDNRIQCNHRFTYTVC